MDINNTQMSLKDIQREVAKKYGFENLSEEDQEKLVENMTEVVIQSIIIDSYEKLNQDDKRLLDIMIDENNPTSTEEVDKFLLGRFGQEEYEKIVKKAVSDLEESMQEVLSSFSS